MRLEDLDHARLLLERHATNFRLVMISRGDTALAATMRRDGKELVFRTMEQVEKFIRRNQVRPKPCGLRGTNAGPHGIDLHGVGGTDVST